MYIVIEGIDTTGKSTQIERLKLVYPNAIFTKEPYDYAIKDFALNYNVDDTTRALLLMADRNMHMQEIVEPALKDNKMVISDRSFVSNIAYCDTLPRKLLIEMNKAISIMPDIVVILNTNARTLRERLENKTNKDSIEKQSIDKLLSIQFRMLDIVSVMGIPYMPIPCNLPVDEVTDRIIESFGIV